MRGVVAGLWACLSLAACDDDGGKTTPGDTAVGADAAADMTVVDAGRADTALPDGAPADASPPDAAPDATPTPEQAELYQVPETGRRVLAGLEGPVHVVATEGDVPHIFAKNRRDLARVHGFIFGRDRFWMMDLGRRLAEGRLSELVGDILLDSDITSRAQGLPQAAQRLLDHLDPTRRAELEAFAEGINAYIEAVRAGELPPPSELRVAAPLLGARQPIDLMAPFTALDVLAFAAVVLEQSTCAKGELERTAALLGTFDAYPEGTPLAALRELGLREDIFYRIEPLEAVFTAGGPQAKRARAHAPAMAAKPFDFPPGMLAKTAERLAGWQARAGKALGSNAWAVAGSHTTDGATLLAGDGHLPLAVPAYFHQAGLDTGVMGGPAWHARGNFLAGLPALGVGTNGQVAWSFTCFYSDTVDYYRETVQLGADGLPAATYFQGEWHPVVRVDETYDTRAVALLMSPGGAVTQPRFETFDGRRLLSIEGRPLEAGESGGVNLGDGFVEAGDTDGDGVVTALSLDATYLDVGDAIGAYYALSDAQNLDEFEATQRKLAVFGSHFVAADRGGHLLATGYHASPCRKDHPHTEDGRQFVPGADPQVVLDGTLYGAFELRLAADGTVDESDTDGPGCVVPYARFPRARDPESGYLVSANNDPAGLSLDGSLADDGIYIGGPWDVGFRPARIDARVAEAAAAHTADIATMASIQADTRSALGTRLAPILLETLEKARTLGGDLAGADARVADLQAAHVARFAEVERRLTAWVAAGLPTPSGVETFYSTPAPGDAEHAVATMIFNAWLGHFATELLGDEPRIPGDRLTDDRAVSRALINLLAGRGADNPGGLASWNPETQESALFDVLGTPEIERSDEVILMALRDALDFLESPPNETAEGGFGTADMDAWIWGLRHTVRFESILAPFVGDIGSFNLLISRFAITTDTLPLAEGLAADDPRKGLVGFPRPGDNDSVDAADNGYRPTRFEYRNGPVKRMVIALHPDGQVEGQNILPGGQSGLTTSSHFADQARLWLGNQTWPLRFHLAEIVAGAEGREVYVP